MDEVLDNEEYDSQESDDAGPQCPQCGEISFTLGLVFGNHILDFFLLFSLLYYAYALLLFLSL